MSNEIKDEVREIFMASINKEIKKKKYPSSDFYLKSTSSIADYKANPLPEMIPLSKKK